MSILASHRLVQEPAQYGDYGMCELPAYWYCDPAGRCDWHVEADVPDDYDGARAAHGNHLAGLAATAAAGADAPDT